MSKEDVTTGLIGQATADQITAWKKEHKEVFSIAVENHVGYFKKPTRAVLSLATTKLQTNPLGYLETIIENTFIGGSKEIIDNDDYFLACIPKVEEMVQIKTAELVKL